MLFVRPNFRMGNLLLVTPALTLARRALPGARIDLLTTSAYDPLLEGHPDIDRVVALDRGMYRRPWALLGLVRTLRAARYDLVIDGSEGESFTGSTLARATRSRWRVTLRPSRYEALYTVRVDRAAAPAHRTERLLWLLEAIGIGGERPPMSIALDASEREWARERWRQWGLEEAPEVVGVNIGARGGKRWPMERFLGVIRRVGEGRGGRVVVFAGPEDMDRLETVEGRLPEDVVVDTTHRVRQFAALLERCSVLVTCDTGPMHLAAAVGTPTVSIFLKENAPVFAPLGEEHVRLECEGSGVEVDAVVGATIRLLDRIRPAARAGGGRPR